MIQTTAPLFMPFVQGRKTEKTGAYQITGL